MKELKSFSLMVVMALLFVTALPTSSVAQNRGRGRGNWERSDRRHNSDWLRNRKCQKFKNCHDARDGRWDGRGPKGDRVGNRTWRNRTRDRWDNNNRWRDRRYTTLRTRRNR